MGDNFWKEQYKNYWDESSKKEDAIKKIIETNTGKKLIFSGLGASSAKYISGSAQSQGFNKGDADSFIEDTNIYLEITGPLSPKIIFFLIKTFLPLH
jgi:hypothetical protein